MRDFIILDFPFVMYVEQVGHRLLVSLEGEMFLVSHDLNYSLGFLLNNCICLSSLPCTVREKKATRVPHLG